MPREHVTWGFSEKNYILGAGGRRRGCTSQAKGRACKKALRREGTRGIRELKGRQQCWSAGARDRVT